MSDKPQPAKPEEQTLVASLSIRGASEAIAWYCEVFGAKEVFCRIETDDGRVGHAELKIGDSLFYVADEWPEFGFCSPKALGGTPVHFMIHVTDVDSCVAKAVEAGAELMRPVENQFYGHRTGQIRDPYDFVWTFSTQVEEVSEDEMQRRWKDFQQNMHGTD